MRSACLFLAVTLIGCFSPSLRSPGYYCHPDDHPACPDGQVCVQGRCQDPGYVNLDAGLGSGGPTADFSTDPSMLDFSTNFPGVEAGTPMTGCASYVTCVRSCSTNTACLASCQANATSMGQQLYQMALSCGQMYCAGAMACDATGTMDASGKPAGSCQMCLGTALSALYGTTCSMTDPNCNPGLCPALALLCLLDTP
jgi:hypothetical protein